MEGIEEEETGQVVYFELISNFIKSSFFDKSVNLHTCDKFIGKKLFMFFHK